jgi:hypothetical protein
LDPLRKTGIINIICPGGSSNLPGFKNLEGLVAIQVVGEHGFSQSIFL